MAIATDIKEQTWIKYLKNEAPDSVKYMTFWIGCVIRESQLIKDKRNAKYASWQTVKN